MSVRSSLNVSLTPELSAYVGGRVASGRYRSDGDLMCRWLRCSQEKVEAIGRIISRDLDTGRFDWCIDRDPGEQAEGSATE